MIHILLLILKIIGIILLVVLALALLLLFFPITYIGKIEFEGVNGNGRMTVHWLFHILHFRINFHGSSINYVLRVFGIPVISSKRKADSDDKEKTPENIVSGKKDNKGTDNSEGVKSDSKEDFQNTKKIDYDKKQEKRIWNKIKRIVGKIKNLLKDSVTNTKSVYNRFKEIKTFVTANTTKEAYNYGKRIIIKLLKHIFPKRITANINLGFDEPHITGQIFGYIAMVYGMFGIDPEKLVVNPDFEKQVFKGTAKCKGHIFLGIAGVYILKLYFKEEIRHIIKKFS